MFKNIADYKKQLNHIFACYAQADLSVDANTNTDINPALIIERDRTGLFYNKILSDYSKWLITRLKIARRPLYKTELKQEFDRINNIIKINATAKIGSKQEGLK